MCVWLVTHSLSSWGMGPWGSQRDTSHTCHTLQGPFFPSGMILDSSQIQFCLA